jgi:hypothetical protein
MADGEDVFSSYSDPGYTGAEWYDQGASDLESYPRNMYGDAGYDSAPGFTGDKMSTGDQSLNQWMYGGNADESKDQSRITGGTRYGGSQTGGQGGTSVTTRTPTRPMPILGSTPAFASPTYDESKVAAYAQQDAALGVSEWRQSLSSGLNKIMSEGNFATRADQMRKMFQGAGTGLSHIMKAATDEGRNRYAQEYNALVQQAIINHQDEVRQAYTQFQADLQNYFQTMQITTSSGGGAGIGMQSGGGGGTFAISAGPGTPAATPMIGAGGGRGG